MEIAAIRRFASYVEFAVHHGDSELRVDLALDSPFRFEPPIETELGVFANDFNDLKIDKVLAYYGRAEPRDAVDLYFILQGSSPGKLFEQAKLKDPGFDLYWFAIALNRAESFPDEIDRWPVKMLQEIDAKELKKVFQNLAIEIIG